MAGDAADKVIPGEIYTGLIHMPHEGAGIEAIVIVIPEDKDIVEVVELEFFQSKGQLYGCGADEDGHLGGLIHLDVMEVLGVLEEKGAKQEFPLIFQPQPVIISKVTRDYRMIKGLGGEKAFELMFCVKALAKKRHRAI